MIYSFAVHKGMADKFIETWSELTRLIYRFEGSYGSRLHQVNDELYIAYAQWPDRATWAASGDRLPETSVGLRTRLRECCREIKTEYELKEIKDLLVNEVFSE